MTPLVFSKPIAGKKSIRTIKIPRQVTDDDLTSTLPPHFRLLDLHPRLGSDFIEAC